MKETTVILHEIKQWEARLASPLWKEDEEKINVIIENLWLDYNLANDK